MAVSEFCYVTTTGRVTGRPHRIEIWYAERPGDGRTLYVLSGGGERSDWVRNLQASPQATVEVDGRSSTARARFPDPGTAEDVDARRLVTDKYQPGYGGDLSTWRERSLVIALDLLD